MRFKFIGEAKATFVHLIHADGGTVEVEPGDEFDVAKDGVLIPNAVLHPDLEAVDDEAKKLVTVEADKARVEASRVMGDPEPAPAPAATPEPEGTTATASAEVATAPAPPTDVKVDTPKT